MIQDKQLHNNIRQGVINSRVTLSQARTAYDTSVEARKLQEQTASGTRRKYELGTATILDVVITQRDTTARELAEVQAKNSYIHARISMETVLGTVLQTHDVSIDDARKGVVGRAPDLIPAVLPQGNGQTAEKR
jgi:outer membrane protein TolC